MIPNNKNGLCIKLRVAPINCIVFINIFCAKMTRRMVLETTNLTQYTKQNNYDKGGHLRKSCQLAQYLIMKDNLTDTILTLNHIRILFIS